MKTISKIWQRRTSRAASSVALGVVLGLAPYAAQAVCVGDCNGSGDVDVSEIITMVTISLGAPVSGCLAGDGNGDGTITVDEIIKAVGNALNGCGPVTATPTPTPHTTGTPACGNNVVEGTEECDDGGQCIGGDNAGTNCTQEADCHGNGVCIGGIKVGTSCANDAACPAGKCVHCRTFGGDGCAANCTHEVDVDYTLVPGVTMGLGIKPKTILNGIRRKTIGSK